MSQASHPKPSVIRDIIVFILIGVAIVLCQRIAHAHVSVGIVTPELFHALARAGKIIFVALFGLRLFGGIYDSLSPQYRTVFLEVMAPMFLIGLSLFLFRGMFEGGIPTTVDHTTHQLRCRLTEEALWQHGTLLPWTSAIGAGVPLNDLYPPGGAILYCMVRFCSFFLLNERNAYIATLFVSWFVLLASLYCTGRTLAGIGAGLFAALCILFDAGSVGLIGWAQCFVIAVWPMTLACGLMLFAVLTFYRIVTTPSSGRWSVLLALLTAASLLVHVMAFMGLMIILGLLTITILLGKRTDNDERSPVLSRILGGWLFSFIGFALTAWWSLPFLASGEWLLPYGSPLSSIHTLAHQTVHGFQFKNTFPLLATLGLFASFLGLLSRKVLPTALSLAYWLLILLYQDTFYLWFYSESLTSIVDSLPILRFMGYSKLLGYLLAGWFLHPYLVNLSQITRRFYDVFFITSSNSNGLLSASFMLSSVFGLMGIVVLVFPIYDNSLNVYNANYSMRDGYVLRTIVSYPPYRKDLHQAILTLREIDPVEDDTLFMPLPNRPRIGIQTNLQESEIPFKYRYGIVPPRYMPTMLFATRASTDDLTASSLAKMKYYFALESRGDELLATGDWIKLKTWDHLTLLEHKYYQDSAVMFKQDWPASAEVVEQSPTHVQLTISGMEGHDWVPIGISRYRKWKAFLDGESIPITEHIGPDEPADIGRYISVYVSNGLLELRYQPERIDRIGTWITWIALILVVLGFVTCSEFGLLSFLIIPCLSFINTLFTSVVFRLLHVVLTLALFLALIVFWYSTPQPQSAFWYGGTYSDATGWDDWTPDQTIDIEFGLRLGEELFGKTISKFTLHEVPPDGRLASMNRWTTGIEPSWKIRVMPTRGEDNQIWKYDGEPFDAMIDRPHYLRLWAANPYKGAYIPQQTKVVLTIHFDDRTTRAMSCTLKPQGYF